MKLPDTFWRAATHEREHGASDELVDVETGSRFTPKKHRPGLIAEAIQTAMVRRVSDTPAPSADLIEYLHERPVRLYSDRVGRALDELLLTAGKTRDADVRQAELQVIRSLRIQPLPVYSTRGRTQRLVPQGQGLTTAPAWIRHAVLDDCVEVDMASAQLALVGSMWDVPSIRGFLAVSLEGGPSFWTEVSTWLRRSFPDGEYQPDRHFERVKGLLKTATYGICFGMTEANVARWGSPYRLGPKAKAQRRRELSFLRRMFGAPSGEVGHRLLEHPLVVDLLAARERRAAMVLEEGHLVDVFGRRYELGTTIDGRDVTPRSVLAAQAQAAEHLIMLHVARPFLDEGRRANSASRPGKTVYPEAEIVLWQSDGLSIRVRQRGRTDSWVARAEDGLAEGCRELERLLGCPPILTRMEVKYAGAR